MHNSFKFLVLLLIQVMIAFSISGQNWPQYSGPYGNFQSDSSDQRVLIDDLKNYRLKWMSELQNMPGRSQARRQRCISISSGRLPSGLASSPIVYKGYIYKYQLEPFGESIDYNVFSPEIWPTLHCVQGGELAQLGYYDWWQTDLDLWKSRAKDVLYCFELETGRLVWRKEMPYLSKYPCDDLTKEYVANYTPAAAEDKVFFMGSSGRVFALDYLTGNTVWEKTTSATSAIENGTRPAMWARGEGSVDYMDGHVIMATNISGFGSNLTSYDPSTGNVNWTTSESATGSNSNPLPFRQNGVSYFFGINQSGVARMFRLSSGAKVWETQIGTSGKFNQGIFVNDTLFARKNNSWSAFLVNATTGLTHLWDAPASTDGDTKSTPHYKNGYVIFRVAPLATGGSKLISLKLSDGSIGSLLDLSAANSYGGSVIIGNFLIMQNDGNHTSDNFLRMFNVQNPANITYAGLGGTPFPAFPSGGYERSMQFPVVKGCMIFLGDNAMYSMDFNLPENDMKVKITNISKPQAMNPGSNIQLMVSATSVSSSISKVEFISNGSKVGEDNVAPFDFTIPSVAPGRYTIFARAINSDGDTALSQIITIRALNPDRLVATPWRKDTLLVGQKMGFKAQIFDSEGTRIDRILKHRLTYSCSHGTVDTTGAYTATVSGKDTLIVAYDYGSGIIRDSVFILVNKASQTITFKNTPNLMISDVKMKLNGFSSSGLPINYSIVSGSASINIDTIYALSVGTVIIKASQPGSPAFHPAEDVFDTIKIKNDPVLAKVRMNKKSEFVQVNNSVLFSASVFDMDDDPFLLPVSFNWSVIGGGTITPQGQFIAPSILEDSNLVVVEAIRETVIVRDTSVVYLSPALRIISVNLGSVNLLSGDDAGAGYFRNNRWNNIGTSTNAVSNLVDDAGTTSSVIVRPLIGGNYVASNLVANNGDDRLLKSYSAANTSSAGDRLKITNIPESFRTNGYSVAIYYNNRTANENLTFSYQINNGQKLFLRDNSEFWDRELSRSYATTAAQAEAGNEYVVFEGLTSDSITIRTEGAARAGISGLQLITAGSNSPRQVQSISFGSLLTKTFGDPDFALEASATSGLPVNFSSSNPSVATVTGNLVNIAGAGVCQISATQAGDNSFHPAVPVVQTLTVNKADQIITFPQIPDKHIQDPDFELNATSSSGLPVSFLVSGVATLVGPGTISLEGDTGIVTVTAFQGGNQNFNSSQPVVRSFRVLEVVTGNDPRHELPFKREVNFFPNPVESDLTVQNADGMPYIIINSKGRTVDKGLVKGPIRFQNYPVGLYLIKIGSRFFKLVKI